MLDDEKGTAPLEKNKEIHQGKKTKHSVRSSRRPHRKNLDVPGGGTLRTQRKKDQLTHKEKEDSRSSSDREYMGDAAWKLRISNGSQGAQNKEEREEWAGGQGGSLKKKHRHGPEENQRGKEEIAPLLLVEKDSRNNTGGGEKPQK